MQWIENRCSEKSINAWKTHELTGWRNLSNSIFQSHGRVDLMRPGIPGIDPEVEIVCQKCGDPHPKFSLADGRYVSKMPASCRGTCQRTAREVKKNQRTASTHHIPVDQSLPAISRVNLWPANKMNAQTDVQNGKRHLPAEMEEGTRSSQRRKGVPKDDC